MKRLIFLLCMVLSGTAFADQKFECFGSGPNLKATDYYIVRFQLLSPQEGRLFAMDNCPQCNRVGGIKQVMANGLVHLGKIQPKNQNYVSYSGAGGSYPYWFEIPRAIVGSTYKGNFKATFVYDMNDSAGDIPYPVVCHQL